jgi:hypothetical protein
VTRVGVTRVGVTRVGVTRVGVTRVGRLRRTVAGRGQRRQRNHRASWVSQPALAAMHAQFDAWKNSHHALAMQPATAATVLGDFAGAHHEQLGVTTTFLRYGEKFASAASGGSRRAPRPRLDRAGYGRGSSPCFIREIRTSLGCCRASKNLRPDRSLNEIPRFGEVIDWG